MRPLAYSLAALALAATALLHGAGPGSPSATVARNAPGLTDDDLDALADVLAVEASGGDPQSNERIRRAQQDLASTHARPSHLEALALAFLAKGRRDGDESWLLEAEACASVLTRIDPGSPGARSLTASILHASHRFEEAAAIAESVAADRGSADDWALLGDVRLDQGDIEGAVAAWERMMRLRPGAAAYARAGEARWRTGDRDGAAEALRMAAQAASPRDATGFAWIHARLASLEAETGQASAALEHSATALAAAPGFPPALVARGIALEAAGATDEAVAVLEQVPPTAHDSSQAERMLARLRAGATHRIPPAAVHDGTSRTPATTRSPTARR